MPIADRSLRRHCFNDRHPKICRMPSSRLDLNKLTVAVVLSAFGTELTHFAIPLFALKILKADPFEMGLLSAIGTLPHLLFGLLVGGFVSNASIQKVLVRMDVVRALLILILGIATFSGHTNVVILCAAVFLLGTATLVFEVTYYSFVPLLVGRHNLMSANSRIETGRTASSLFGNAIVGSLVQFLGFFVAFLLDALTFLISAASIYLIRWRIATDSAVSSKTQHSTPTIRQQISTGFSFIGSNKVVLVLVVSGALYNFFTAMEMAMFSYFAANTLNFSLTLIAILLTLASVGSLIGAYAADFAQRTIGFGGAIVVGYLINAVCSLIVPLTDGEHAAIIISIALLVGGIGGMQAGIVQLSLRQAIVPSEIATTVNAAVRFVLWGVLPLGGILSGLIASVVGVRLTLVLAAVGLIGAALVPLFASVWRVKDLPTSAA